MDVEDALELLYGNKPRDLTSQGYTTTLEQMRLSNPTLARHIERVLDSFLKERVFTRRQKQWYNTSEGTRVRLVLLLGNPHFQADVCIVREVLGIPTGHIHTTQDHALWKHLQETMKLNDLSSERIRRIVEGNLAGAWLHIHRMASSGRTVEEEDCQLLSIEMCESASKSARVNLGSDDVPEWLRHPTGEIGPQTVMEANIDWAVGRLIERHNLPEHVLTSITMFVLTQDASWLEGLEPLEVTLDSKTSKDLEAFSVSVKKIDEFTTKDDWDRVWGKYVKPRQKFLWEKRGMKPHGRRTRDITRLKKALPFYRRMIEANRQFIEQYSLTEVAIEEETLNIEMEDLRKAIRDLQRLLRPKP